MKRFIIEKSKNEFYTSHSGLALVGLCLNRFTSLTKRLGQIGPLKKGAISHADVLRSYIGLLCLGPGSVSKRRIKIASAWIE